MEGGHISSCLKDRGHFEKRHKQLLPGSFDHSQTVMIQRVNLLDFHNAHDVDRRCVSLYATSRHINLTMALRVSGGSPPRLALKRHVKTFNMSSDFISSSSLTETRKVLILSLSFSVTLIPWHPVERGAVFIVTLCSHIFLLRFG